jgi:hypothetical protein
LVKIVIIIKMDGRENGGWRKKPGKEGGKQAPVTPAFGALAGPADQRQGNVTRRPEAAIIKYPIRIRAKTCSSAFSLSLSLTKHDRSSKSEISPRFLNIDVFSPDYINDGYAKTSSR